MHFFKKFSVIIAISIFLLLGLPFLDGVSNAAEYPLTVIDETGTAVTLSKEPQRFISTAPSNTEILFALGLGEKVVGVTNYCNYPEAAKHVEKIGEISPLNYEKIISLKPDLVLAYGGFQLKDIPRLRELGIIAIVLEPLNLKDTFKSS